MMKLRHLLLALAFSVTAAGLAPLDAIAKPIGADAPKCSKCCGQNLPDMPAGEGPCADITGGSFVSTSYGTMGASYPIVSAPTANGAGLDLSLHYASYNADGEKASLNTVMGFGWSHSYNIFVFAQGRDLFKMSPGGLVSKYQRIGRGGTLTATRAVQQTITQSADGKVVEIRNNQDGLTFRFEKITDNPLRIAGIEPWMLTLITDRDDNKTTLTYHNGLLSLVEDTYQRQIKFDYDAQHQLTRITDPLGRITELSYDGSYNLASIRDPLTQTTAYEYNARHQLVAKTDKNGKRWAYLYDAAGHPTGILDASGNRVFNMSNPNEWATSTTELFVNNQRVYTPSTTSRIDGRGNTWRYEYDSNAYLRKIIAPDGATTTYTYDDVYDPAHGKFATLNVDSIEDANLRTTSYEYDAKGNRIKMTDALGHVTTYEYEPVFNHVVRITYPNLSVTEYEYDAEGNRTQEIRDVGGLNLQENWTYDSKGNVLTEAVRNARSPSDVVIQTTSYEYDSYGNRTKVTDPEDNVTQYEYDILGNRTKMINANTHETDYEYDALNRLVKITDPLLYTTEYAYDGNDNRIQVKKQATLSPAAYEITIYQYDLRNRMTRETRILPAAPLLTAYAYDGNDNRTSVTDPRGKITRFEYDVQNRMTLVRDALVNTTQTLYDGVGNRTRTIDANGHYAYFEYDELNRLTKEIRKIGDTSPTTDGDDIVTQDFYDVGNAIAPADCGNNPQCAGPTPGSSNVAYTIDPENKYTYFKYDKVDRRVMTLRKVSDTLDARDGDDWADIMQYDSAGNVLTRTDPNGNASTFTYYLNNWKKTEANALAETTYYTYDGVGNVLTVTAPNLNVTTNSYSPRNELANVSDSVGQVASYTYDGVGNRLTETDGNSNTTAYQYDLVNRLIAITDAMSQTSIHRYDPANNLLQTTDREGKATCYSYDDINRRTLTTQKMGNTNCAVVDADDLWTATEYDHVGNVLRLITAKHNGTNTPANCASGMPGPECEITRYAYDEVNRLKTETYPDAKQRSFTYDKAGNLKTRLDQNGITTAYFYNDLYYLTQRAYPASFDSFGYDTGGRMLTATRSGWVDGFVYDAANRVKTATQGGKTVSYVYDIPGRIRTVTYPGGKIITEHTDPRSRLDTITNGPATPIVQYAYDLGNRVDTRTYRNGAIATYAYNANNWITDLNHKAGATLIAGFHYDYDKEGNKRDEQKLHDAPHSEAYQYDDVYRLVNYKVGTLVGSTVPVPTTQSQYNLDKVGNWDSLVVNGSPQTRTHNTVNEITTINGAPLTYDNNGNLKQDPRYQYAFDEENRLTRVTRLSDSRVMGQYRYDALSRRIAKIANLTGTPVETRYFYDDARIVEEQDTAGATLATYVYGNYIDEVLTMDRGGQTYYYHQNALWSVAAVTDGAANVAERYSYDAYGFATITDASGTLVPVWDVDRPRSAIGNPWMFTGRQLDEESGLYYYRARYYDALKGRFLQRDPLGYSEAVNVYEYTNGRVTRGIDPYGLVPFSIITEVDWYAFTKVRGWSTPYWEYSSERGGTSRNNARLDVNCCEINPLEDDDESDTVKNSNTRFNGELVAWNRNHSWATKAKYLKPTNWCNCNGKSVAGLDIIVWHAYSTEQTAKVTLNGGVTVEIGKEGVGKIGGTLGGTIEFGQSKEFSKHQFEFKACPVYKEGYAGLQVTLLGEYWGIEDQNPAGPNSYENPNHWARHTKWLLK